MLRIDRIHKRWTRRALKYSRGNRTHAADYLGVSLRTIRNWIKRFDLAREFPPSHMPHPVKTEWTQSE